MIQTLIKPLALACASFLVGGEATWLPRESLAEFIDRAPAADKPPTVPVRGDSPFAGLPMVQLDGVKRLVPVIALEGQGGKHLYNGQFLLERSDGKWMSARPLISPFIFEPDTIFEDPGSLKLHERAGEMRMGADLALRLSWAGLGPEVYGIWMDRQGMPFLVQELSGLSNPLRQPWSLKDLFSLESLLRRLRDETPADLLNVFQHQRARLSNDDIIDGIGRDRLRAPLDFCHDSLGRVHLAGFSYGAWYFHTRELPGILRDLRVGLPSGDWLNEHPDDALGVLTLVRLKALLGAADGETAKQYLLQLRIKDLRAWLGLKDLAEAVVPGRFVF